MAHSLCRYFSHLHFGVFSYCLTGTAHSLASCNLHGPLNPFHFNNTGYGSAGVGRKVQPDLLFRIASISKTITAVGIMRLVEEQKLSLEDRVFGAQGI